MSSIEFHSTFRRDCESCGYSATHGFVIIEGKVATFECTACSQRHFDRVQLEAAIERHRQLLFSQTERRLERSGGASPSQAETTIFARPSQAETTIFNAPPGDATTIRSRPRPLSR